MKKLKVQRELLILRHGKSDWRCATNDFKRPLKNRGKRAAQKMGVWLQQQNLMPDYILSSPAERALNTTEKLCTAMGLGVLCIHQDKRLYASEVMTLKQVLAECPESAMRVLLVGHNPELEELLEDLVDQDISAPEDGKLLPTATLARLYLPDNWNKLKSGCAQLHSITRPSSLP